MKVSNKKNPHPYGGDFNFYSSLNQNAVAQSKASHRPSSPEIIYMKGQNAVTIVTIDIVIGEVQTFHSL